MLRDATQSVHRGRAARPPSWSGWVAICHPAVTWAVSLPLKLRAELCPLSPWPLLWSLEPSRLLAMFTAQPQAASCGWGCCLAQDQKH